MDFLMKRTEKEVEREPILKLNYSTAWSCQSRHTVVKVKNKRDLIPSRIDVGDKCELIAQRK